MLMLRVIGAGCTALVLFLSLDFICGCFRKVRTENILVCWGTSSFLSADTHTCDFDTHMLSHIPLKGCISYAQERLLTFYHKNE